MDYPLALTIFAFQPLRHDKFTVMSARTESIPFKNSALPNASGNFDYSRKKAMSYGMTHTVLLAVYMLSSRHK